MSCNPAVVATVVKTFVFVSSAPTLFWLLGAKMIFAPTTADPEYFPTPDEAAPTVATVVNAGGVSNVYTDPLMEPLSSSP